MTKTKKAKKPRRNFPLWLHGTGQWCKKVRGKFYYFGSDAAEAEARWDKEKADILADRPVERRDGPLLRVRDLCNCYMASKRLKMEAGELSPRTWRGLYDLCERLVELLGASKIVMELTAGDFETVRAEFAKVRGPVALADRIQKTRSVFGYAYADGLIDRPVRFGSAFKKPTAKVIRKARNDAGSRMWEAEELRKIIEAAKQPMKAMILLALNAGYGQSDCAALPIVALDFKTGYVTFPRPKTAVMRRCPLWPATIKALQEAIATRPEAKDPADADAVFITKYGKRWVRVNEGESGRFSGIDSVNLEFNKLLNALGLKRNGGFYNLRHVHRTIADGAKDQPAANFLMGHVDESMGGMYRERIDDGRLQAVTDCVHAWLFPAAAGAPEAKSVDPEILPFRAAEAG